jgi:hypothetical protein
LDSDKWMTVVVVVGDVRQESPAERPGATLYMPMTQHPFYANQIHVVLRTAVKPLNLINAVDERIARVDPLIARRYTTMDAMVDKSVATERFRAALISSFAGVGLLLAMLGVYGTMAYSVAQRRFEFGVKMALGAERGTILRSVLGHASKVACVGIMVWHGVGRGAGAAGGEHAGGSEVDGSGELGAGVGAPASDGTRSGTGAGVERDAGESDSGAAGGMTVKRIQCGKAYQLFKTPHQGQGPIRLLVLCPQSRLSGKFDISSAAGSWMRGLGGRIHATEAKSEAPFDQDNLAPTRPRSFQELSSSEPWICGIEADLRGRYRRFHNLVLLRAASRLWTNRGAEI